MINKLIKELTFTVFDTETTGLSPYQGSKLVEIAAIKIEPNLTLNLKNRFETLIDPCCEIPYRAFAVHKISNDMVKGKPREEIAIPQFLNFVGDNVAIAHNAGFDCKFVDHTIEQHSIDHNFTKIIDTIGLAKIAFPDFKKYNLDNLIEQLNLEVPVPSTYRHRAFFDAAHTALLTIRCFEALETRGIKKLSELEGRHKSLFYKWY